MIQRLAEKWVTDCRTYKLLAPDFPLSPDCSVSHLGVFFDVTTNLSFFFFTSSFVLVCVRV